MASIDSGGGHGGKKSGDQEIPLVPFIDLLFCCIMFLLAAAVWNQLARLQANQSVPGQAAQDDQPPEDERVRLTLHVQTSGYTLASDAGDRITIARNGDEYDIEELRTKLQERKRLEPNREDLIVSPEDGVRYEDVIQAMDIVTGEGFSQMSLGGGAL